MQDILVYWEMSSGRCAHTQRNRLDSGFTLLRQCEVAIFVRAVRDSGNRLLATQHRPNLIRLEECCYLALVESTKAKVSTNSAGYVEHWAGGQREKCFVCEKEQLPPFVEKHVFQSDVDLLSQSSP